MLRVLVLCNVGLILMYLIYSEGARTGWILVADHPSACDHLVSAVL